MPSTISFLSDNLPSLLFGTLFVLGLVIIFADSIRKHPKVYYIIFAVLSTLALSMRFGPESFEVIRNIPLISDITHAASFGMPLLIIVMYIGALNPKRPTVQKLFMIRKELAIIGGMVMLVHATLRVSIILNPDNWWILNSEKFKEVMESDGLALIGTKISFLGYYLGGVMFVLLFILWITSFDKIHKSLGSKRWKKIQKWSYLLYFFMFLHSFFLNLGWTIGDYSRLIVSTAEERPDNLKYFINDLLAVIFTILLFGSYYILKRRKQKAIAK